MRLVVKYAKRTKNGGYIYRRRVPQDLLSIIGKREFKPALGETEAVAVRAYARVHDAVEHQIRRARRAVLAVRGSAADNITPSERFAAAQGSVSDLLRGVVGLTDDEAREVVAERIAAKYPFDPETGDPVGITAFDSDRLRLLTDANSERPKKTVEDAARLYVQERLGGGLNGESKKNAQRAQRIVGYVQAALGRNRALEELTREDGRKVRDFMLGVSKVNGALKRPASVKREINQIKAIFNFALHEFELTGKAINPFSKIEIPGLDQEAESEQRDPLPAEVIAAVRHRLGTAKPELGLIWRLLEGTGCRLAEITGLRVEDVDVAGEWPCIRVTWHEERRVKTKASRRYVPLVGDALLAAKEALQLPPSGPMLFPSYGRQGGPVAASNVLMDHLRKVSKNPRHVVHSLRHNMKDRLIEAEVPYFDQNLILGHALGGVGDRVYGGAPAKLRATTKAMEKAMGLLRAPLITRG